jgi:hypothetical protein
MGTISGKFPSGARPEARDVTFSSIDDSLIAVSYELSVARAYTNRTIFEGLVLTFSNQVPLAANISIVPLPR